MFTMHICRVHGSTQFKYGFCMECTKQEEEVDECFKRALENIALRQMQNQREAHPEVAFHACSRT